MTSLIKPAILLSIISMLMATSFRGQNKNNQTAGGDPELEKKIRRFAPTVLTADTSKLSANDRKALQDYRSREIHGSVVPAAGVER